MRLCGYAACKQWLQINQGNVCCLGFNSAPHCCRVNSTLDIIQKLVSTPMSYISCGLMATQQTQKHTPTVMLTWVFLFTGKVKKHNIHK
jgi:hypothetical protein